MWKTFDKEEISWSSDSQPASSQMGSLDHTSASTSPTEWLTRESTAQVRKDEENAFVGKADTDGI